MSDGTCALPPHLRDKKHNDWPIGLRWIKRGFNAYGPRCKKGSDHHRPWPPRLVEGFGVARWENTGASSIIEIPSLRNVSIDSNIYERRILGYERNPSHENFNKLVEIEIKWQEAQVWDELIDDRLVQFCYPNDYHPSALQSFSPKGWMKLDPYYKAWWKRIYYDKPEPALNTRKGYRPDSLDAYYNKSIIYLGLNYE